MRRLMFVAALLVPTAAGAVAVDQKRLDDPAKEALAREVMAEVRCLVCQNQSIEDSNAPLAQDLRQIVREQVAKEKSAEEIKAFLVERYGDWVLLSPPFNARTAMLWIFPPLLLGLVIGAIALRISRPARQGEGPQPLDAAERARIARLLDKGDGK